MSNLCLMVGSSVLRWMATRIVLSCALATDDDNNTNVNANNSRYLFQWSNWPCSDVEQLCRVMMCLMCTSVECRQIYAVLYNEMTISHADKVSSVLFVKAYYDLICAIFHTALLIAPIHLHSTEKSPFLLITIMFWPVNSNCNPRRRVIIIINAMDINVPQ